MLVDDTRGVLDAASMLIAKVALRKFVTEFGDAKPIGSTSSMVANRDPQVGQARSTFRGRILKPHPAAWWTSW